MEHNLVQPPTRDPETLDCLAVCSCGAAFIHNDKETCWDMIVEHTVPFIKEEIDRLTKGIKLMQTYENRKTEERVVEDLSEGGILYEGGMGHGLFDEMKGRLKVGDTVTVETKGLSRITGIMFDGQWLFRKSDQDLDREHQQFVADWKRQREEELEKNRVVWQMRTDDLPDWIRARIEWFRSGDNDFDADGWAYELCIAELAVLYLEHGLDDSDKSHPIWDYASKYGTSGNQHGFARALAKARMEDEGFDASGTASGLSPITGDVFYDGDKLSG